MITRRTLLSVAGLTGTSAVLAGCSADIFSDAAGPGAPVTANPEPAPSPAVRPEQYQQVLSEVVTTVTEADAAYDAELLATRMDGTAFLTRRGQYFFASQSIRSELLAFSDTSLLGLVGNSPVFPRQQIAFVEPPEGVEDVPRLVMMAQADARAAYKAWGVAKQLPGTVTPSVNTAAVGNDLVAPDDTSLLKTPVEALDAYLVVLSDGLAADPAFADDPFRQTLEETRTADQAALDAGVETPGQVATLTETFTRNPEEFAGFRTVDGGAIVAGSFDSVRAMTVNEGTVRLDDWAPAMTGLTEFTQHYTEYHGASFALYVPAAGSSEKIQAIAAHRSIYRAEGA
jgi:hypothetical protein